MPNCSWENPRINLRSRENFGPALGKRFYATCITLQQLQQRGGAGHRVPPALLQYVLFPNEGAILTPHLTPLRVCAKHHIQWPHRVTEVLT